MSNEVYYNTNKLEGEDLTEAQEKALGLKNIILGVFEEHPEPKTPFQVAVLLIKRGYKYPITSIRARMTKLRKEEKLVMSPKAETRGEYDSPNHTWWLNGWEELSA